VEPVRAAIALWILWLLVRVARASWRQRELTLALWRAVGVRHVGGALVLLVVVAGVAGALVRWVPGAELGIGHLVGLTGNAVFAPLEEGLARAGPPPTSGPDWPLLVGASSFLGPLLLLLPWLAFVEEEVFRAGLEDAGRRRLVGSCLVFGLAHLVMLVPIGAALAIALAGGAYTLVYRRAHAAAGQPGGPSAPAVARRSYRPTRRARVAAARARPLRDHEIRAHEVRDGEVRDGEVRDGEVRDGERGNREHGPDPEPAHAGDREPAHATPDAPLVVGEPEDRQAAAVFAAAVWHTTFNSVLVVLVWFAFAVAALSPTDG
jgi:membrane protease YdiL (CAAX protease family)